jgi:APA family basic amino acid/polyamine antiporter
MAIAGIVVGLINGNTVEAFEKSAQTVGADFTSVFAAVAAAAFAYDGWIIATSINAELHNSKRNLPIALTIGSIVIISIYIFYFVALAGATPVDVLMEKGSTVAFTNLFGNVAGTILNVFVAISCLGTLNGLMLANTRGLYSIAVRGKGPSPEKLSTIDEKSNSPTNSGLVALLLTGFWYFYFYAANLCGALGIFSFDSSELPIITIYAMYIPIFVVFIAKEGKKSFWKNAFVPTIAILASTFMAFSAFYAHGIAPFIKANAEGRFSFPALIYLAVFVADIVIGLIFYKKTTSAEIDPIE